MKKGVYRIRIFVCLIVICFGVKSNAQIHVGPENNVGVKIHSDSTIGFYVDGLVDTGLVNIYNAYFDRLVSSNAGNSFDNVYINSRWDFTGGDQSNSFAYGLNNQGRIDLLNDNDFRYGIYNNYIESSSVLTESDGLGNGTSIHNFMTALGDGFHIGISNTVNVQISSGGRIGIRNDVGGYAPQDGVLGSQYGIYNALQGFSGESLPIALYSTISTPDTFNYAGYFNGNINVTGKIFNFPSDTAVKKNIANVADGLSKILQMNPVSFEYRTIDDINLPRGTQYGLLAQDLETILPDLVEDTHLILPASTSDIIDEQGNVIDKTFVNGEQEIIKSVDYIEVIPFLIRAIQEQQAQIDSLEQQIGNLQNPNTPKSK